MKTNTFTCDHCGQHHPVQEGIEVGNDLLCPSCAERLTVLCDHCSSGKSACRSI